MSEPAMFALVRDGEMRYFADRWAGATLRRELMWGPEDFEKWVLQFEPLDEWEDECDGAAVIDFDRRILTWNGDTSSYRVPRVQFVYQKMLAAAWPDFEIHPVSARSNALVKHLQSIGQPNTPALIAQDGDAQDESSDYRPATVEEAKRPVADEEEGQEAANDTVRAWVTIVDADGRTRQRHLDRLPLDLLSAAPEALSSLSALEPAVVPPEAIVSEGLCISPSQRTAGFWGSPELFALLKKHEARWNGWQLTWLKRGYADQCRVAGTRGMPMRNAEAVAKVVPLILSTQQFNAEVMLNAIGGGLKKFANKAIGCLLLVISLPLVIFGLVSGNWRSVFITIAITAAVVLGAYRLVVARFKRMVNRRMLRGEDDTAKRLAAGPQDQAARRKRIDELLKRAGLPRMAEVEPLFSDKSGLELLAES
jgi:hypothetical protein